MAVDKFTLPPQAISFPKTRGMVQPVSAWIDDAVKRVQAGESIEAVSLDMAIKDLLVEQGNAEAPKPVKREDTTDSFSLPFVPVMANAIQGVFSATAEKVNENALEGARNEDVAINAIPLGFYSKSLYRELVPILAECFIAGANLGKSEVNNTAKRVAVSVLAAPFEWDLDNDTAIEWAREHAAELVKGITKTTRDYLRTAITAALEEHSEAINLTASVMEIIGNRARAEMIARTESIKAVNLGQRAAWEAAKDQGVLPVGARRRWSSAPDCCPVCDELDGRVTDLDKPYFGGHDGPPAHPNCRCSEVLDV